MIRLAERDCEYVEATVEAQQEEPAVDNTPVIEIPDATGNTSALAVAEAVPVTETEPTTAAPASDTNPQT